MKRDSLEQDRPEQESSRFAYFGNGEPESGGVYSVGAAKPSVKPGGTPNLNAGPRPASNGIPGPGERLLDISELARTIGMHYVHRFQIPPLDGAEEGLTLAGPMEGQIRLTNTGAVLLVTGDVHAPLTLECGRCLTPTVAEVDADIEEQFDLVAASTASRQDVVTVVDEDTPASVIEGGSVLNLGELLRQNLLVAAPLQPLCREDCPGIDLSGHPGVAFSSEEDAGKSDEPTPLAAEDNPLRRLADLLAEKRRQEEINGTSAS
ncbi:MAG: DUF177 domain-containing protein [Armatimonadota bacterium]